MLAVDDYGAIRWAHRDGLTIRQIACHFGPSRRTARHVLTHGKPPPGPYTRHPDALVLGPFFALYAWVAYAPRSPSSAATSPRSASGSCREARVPVGRAFQPDDFAPSGWKARPTFCRRRTVRKKPLVP